MRTQKGFTLIELLIVIAIIAILAVVVFVALDPLSRFQDARDAQRWSDVAAIAEAVKLDQVDNGGNYLAAIQTGISNNDYHTIGTNGATGCDAGCSAQTTEDDCVDLTGLVTEEYLPAVPMDPSTGTADLTDYYLQKKGKSITVGACDPEGGSAIEVTR